MQQCCEQQTQTRRQCRRVPYQVQEEVLIPGRPGIRIPDIQMYMRQEKEKVYNEIVGRNNDKTRISF